LKDTFERRSAAIAAALGIGLVVLAWTNRFVQDDAFISFRYARNLVDGIGLAWNPGERVEGYTNFLWTLLVAAGMKLGAEPVLFTQALGLSLFTCSLIFTWRLGVESGLGRPAALLTLLLTGTNYTFSCYATGGLETPLVTAIFLAGCVLAVRIRYGASGRERGLLVLSILCAAGILTRMDTALLFAVPFVAVLAPVGKRRLLPDLVRLTALPVLIVGSWLVWKYSFYGDIFPQPFYLKALGASSPEHGARYFYTYIVSYDLVPFLFFFIFSFGILFLREHRTRLVMVGIVSLWFAYIWKVGGDFMEFRFMVPVIPLMTLLLVWMLFSRVTRNWIRVAGALLVLGGSIHHAITFSYNPDVGIEPVRDLNGHLYHPWENWTGIGKALGAAFRPSDSVTIATTAAGAIPYYSRLRSVDMLGLNTPGAASRGVFIGYVPGHQRILGYEFLEERGVNLVISHPSVRRIGERSEGLPLLPSEGTLHLRGKVIAMPIGNGYEAEMFYIRPNAAVDSAIARLGWEVRQIAY
jgi:arabinofuranosyltransferase